MKEKKLTAEEIVKALERLSKQTKKSFPNYGNIFEDALDLIHRLQSENAEYKRKIEDGELVSKDWHDEQVLHDKAEIERLENALLDKIQRNEELIADCQTAQKQVDNEKKLYDLAKAFHDEKCAEFEKLCYDYHKLENRYKQAVKDTAKEIFQELFKIAEAEYLCGLPNPNKGKLPSKMLKVWAKECYGVEVE